MELTQAYLKECFDYDPETGNLIWRERPRSHFKTRQAFESSRRFVGRAAGACDRYRLVHLGKLYGAHRLVWFWHHGRFPAGEIDHINRDGLDNRIENLRECSRTQNVWCMRSKRQGLRGVYRTSSNRWQALIRVDGKKRHLGCFDSEKDAALAYARAAVDHFGKFAPIEAKELFNEAYP